VSSAGAALGHATRCSLGCEKVSVDEGEHHSIDDISSAGAALGHATKLSLGCGKVSVDEGEHFGVDDTRRFVHGAVPHPRQLCELLHGAVLFELPTPLHLFPRILVSCAHQYPITQVLSASFKISESESENENENEKDNDNINNNSNNHDYNNNDQYPKDPCLLRALGLDE
jgi:hypothetical protein